MSLTATIEVVEANIPSWANLDIEDTYLCMISTTLQSGYWYSDEYSFSELEPARSRMGYLLSPEGREEIGAHAVLGVVIVRFSVSGLKRNE